MDIPITYIIMFYKVRTQKKTNASNNLCRVHKAQDGLGSMTK